MTRRPRQKQQGMRPATALLLLLVCGAIAWISLVSGSGGAASDDTGDMLLDEVEPAADESEAVAPGVDLLARHGSWSASTPVRMAFASVVAAPPAAPGGETVVSGLQRWVGADPPTMAVGVVLVGDTARRAVVEGRVVGVGDAIGRALVVAVEREGLVVQWGDKRLTYGLDSAWPREFHVELLRRGIDPNLPAGRLATDDGALEEPK